MTKSIKKIRPINYTARDFNSIKAELVSYAQRYYPEVFRDFNEAGFGALTLDTVAYIGDILSFYLDYSVNELFLDSAIEYDNIVKLARQLGYKYKDAISSTGIVQLYVSVPADSVGTPDSKYFPTLRAGSEFTSLGGTLFTLLDDVYFNGATNQVVVSKVNSATGVPTQFAIRATGRVVSGKLERQTTTLGAFQRFRTVALANPATTEVVSVRDSEGHRYYEVDHLAQEIIYRPLRNVNAARDNVASILKAVPVPRRFVLERGRNSAFLQFGYGSDSEITNESIVDPTNLTLKIHGRDYYSQTNFDPTNLTKTDKFGVAPSNTTLAITYRVNDAGDVNAASNSISTVSAPLLVFEGEGTLEMSKVSRVKKSLEVNNEDPILGDVDLPSGAELKQRVFSFYASQNRAVTPQDYSALAYMMPPSFGAVKNCSLQRDFDSFKRNLNMYIISQDSQGYLVKSNHSIKTNLKTWLSQYKMINDTIDILDARVVNFGIRFSLITDIEENKFSALSLANNNLRRYFLQNPYDIGQDLRITDIYKVLQRIPNVIDVLDVKLVPKQGGVYSNTSFDFEQNLSNDGRRLLAEKDTIFEVKYPNTDVQGTVT